MNLRDINLGFNKIESIEVISSINCPELKNLSLNSNNINTISTLKKLLSTKIVQLDLQNNEIVDAHTLTLCANRLNWLYLRYQQPKIRRV